MPIKYNFDIPLEKIITKTYSSFLIKNINVMLNQGAKITVILYPENTESDDIQVNTIELTIEEYSLWGTDDQYIIDLIKTKLQN